MTHQSMPESHDGQSEIAKLSEDYLQKAIELTPSTATYIGIEGFDHLLDDYSFDASKEIESTKYFLKKLLFVKTETNAQSIAKSAMQEDLIQSLKILQGGYHNAAWGVVNSPVEDLQSLFAIMPTDTKVQKDNILKRVSLIPTALSQWRDCLLKAAETGFVNTRLETEETIKQFEKIANDKTYQELITSLHLPEMDGVRADEAHLETAKFLQGIYLPLTRINLGVGEKAYRQLAKCHVGTSIDLQKTFHDAIHELSYIQEEIKQVALSIYPDASSVEEVIQRLDADPAYQINGTDNLIRVVETFIEEAKTKLQNQFKIPEQIKACVVKLDTESLDASPYYTSPSEDFSRPGAVSYPTLGKEVFHLWRQVSTIYHESIPGHHLQIATSMLQSENLTTYQRNFGWNSGYGEGWALYAERIMDELGFYENPAYKLGHLLDRSLRTARVVIDMGIHLSDPDEGGWSFENAVEYLKAKTFIDHDYAVSEIHRYISWPGQAISYKIGEQYWLEARKKALESGISMQDFHAKMLEAGPMPLGFFRGNLNPTKVEH